MKIKMNEPIESQIILKDGFRAFMPFPGIYAGNLLKMRVKRICPDRTVRIPTTIVSAHLSVDEFAFAQWSADRKSSEFGLLRIVVGSLASGTRLVAALPCTSCHGGNVCTSHPL